MYSREEPEKYQPREQSEYNRSSDHHQSQPEEYKPGPIPVPKHHRDIDWLLNPPAPEPQPNFQAQKLEQTAQNIGLEYIPLGTDIEQLALHLNQIAQVSPQAQIWWLSILGNLPLWGGLLDSESGRLILKTAAQEYALVEGNAEDLHRCLQEIPKITGEETPYQEYPLLRGLDRNLVEVAEDVMSGARKEDIQDFIAAAISGEASVDYHKEEVIPLLNWAAIQAGEQPQDWVTADREKAVFSAVISDRTIFVHPYDVNVADDLVTAIELLYQRRASTPKKEQAIVDAMTKIINNDNRWGTDSNDLRRMLNEIIKLEAETREGWATETNEQRESKQQLVTSSDNLNPQKSLSKTQNSQNLAQPKSLNKTDHTLSRAKGKDSLIGSRERDNLIANQNNPTYPPQKPSIVINSETDIAVPGTETEYSVNLGTHSEPSDKFTYRWEIFYDLTDLEPEQRQETGLFGQPKYPEYRQFDESKKGRLTTTWQFSGKHTIVVYVYNQGRLRNSLSLTQVVEPIQTIAVEAFENKTPSGLEVDVYLTQLQLQKQILENQGADDQKIEQIISEVESKLAVTAENPQGMGIPLKAVLVPVAQPQAVPLQLYLKPIDDGKWEIVDLTDLQTIRTYPGKDQSAAWTNYLKNNPHPAGEMVAELPALETGTAPQIRQGHSDGASGLQKISKFFGDVGMGTGLLALTITLFTGVKGGIVVGTLYKISLASGVVSGSTNITDRVKHDNFQWDSETAFDLLDIAPGILQGTTKLIASGGKIANNADKLKNITTVAGYIDNGLDGTEALILGAVHIDAIVQIINNPDLEEAEKSQQIAEVIASAVKTGGLMYLGRVAGKQNRNNTNTSTPKHPVETSKTPKTPTDTNKPQVEPKNPTYNQQAQISFLSAVLPQDLQGIPIRVDENLDNSTIQIHYQDGLEIIVGKKATVEGMKHHVPFIKVLKSYQGLTGQIRQLLEKISNWITRNGKPPYGTLAWEADLEIRKLSAILESNQGKLASGKIDDATRLELEAQIQTIQGQITHYSEVLRVMDTDPGKGYIAVEFTADSNYFADKLVDATNTIAAELQELPSSDKITELTQRNEQLKIRNQELEKLEADYINDQASITEAEIRQQKKELIEELDSIENELFLFSRKNLTLENSGLGSGGYTELKKWYEDIVDTEELINQDPELQKEFGSRLKTQKALWLEIPGQSKPDGLTGFIKDCRKDLTVMIDRVAKKLISGKEAKLKPINEKLEPLESKITKLNRELTELIRSRKPARFQNPKRTRSKIEDEIKPLREQEKPLKTEKEKLNQEIEQIEKIQHRIKPDPDLEPFDNKISAEEVWEKLSQDHDTGKSSSSQKWSEVLIREGIISSDQDIIDYIETLQPGGKTPRHIRRQIKGYYRPKLLKLIDSQPKPLKYQKMRDIAESLDVREQGEISEQWYQKEFAKERGVPNSTQAVLDKAEAAEKYGIELTSKKNRRFDEVYGDENSATIREHKHIQGDVDTDQFDDNIQIVQHNRNIDIKIAQGTPLTKSKKDTSLILEKDGKKYRPNKLVYTFATPEGARANVKWMATELRNNQRFLSFEIINSKGEIKIVKYKNIEDLDEPALSQWLDSSSISNSNINS